MAENLEYSKMFFYDDDSDSPEKCRDRRRRRTELRRWASAAALEGNGSRLPEVELPVRSSSSPAGGEVELSSGKGGAVVSEEAAPEIGFMSLAGRKRQMEDAISIRVNLCWPEICRRQPVHFFAVFDGHGGPHVAAMCRERMHVILKEELARVKSTRGWRWMGSEAVAGTHGYSPAQPILAPKPGEMREDDGGEEEEEEVVGWWKAVLTRAFRRMDEVVLSSCSCACGNANFKCLSCHHGGNLAIAGSTAVVAVLTPRHIIVANCGDSRAVLCRGGRVVPLSFDHKPDRPDELARIQFAGGHVINVKGARVQGVLAMSRSIGDKFLKPYLTSDPEISITKRDPEDECLILASDGLWDVIPSDLACEITRSCLKEGIRQGEGELCCPNQSMLVAALLTRLALGRDSSDNISTIVVNLERR